MIRKITNLKVGDRFFLVQYHNTILKFLEDGSFLTSIGTTGRGPNEILGVHDIEIEKKNQNIYLVDGWAKKFCVFSGNGKFKRTFKIPLYAVIDFTFIDDNILCYSNNHMGNIENSYVLMDTNGLIIKNFPNRYPFIKYKNDAYGYEFENIFYKFNNRIYKKEVYSDTVYSYENMEFKPHLVIEAGDRLIVPQVRSEFPGLDIAKNYISPRRLFEFGDYIYYEFFYEIIPYSDNIIYGFIGSKRDDIQVFINSEKGIINDLDGGPDIWPRTIKDDNTIITWIDAPKLKAYVASETFKDSKPKYPEKKKGLEKLAERLKETDNPVLVLVMLNK
jgi:hypothetical protein